MNLIYRTIIIVPVSVSIIAAIQFPGRSGISMHLTKHYEEDDVVTGSHLQRKYVATSNYGHMPS
jgi:hypothetical protein